LFDIKLWCCLCFLARDRGWCDPTDDALAAETQASPQTVRRALHRLEQERFVARGMEGRARIIRLNPEGSGEPVPAYELKVVS
jgi:CTP-dependent riboflavin kinase